MSPLPRKKRAKLKKEITPNREKKSDSTLNILYGRVQRHSLYFIFTLFFLAFNLRGACKVYAQP